MPFVLINGKEVFYTLDQANDLKPPSITTLFIHGLGSSSCFWQTITSELEDVTRCVALDTPGSGMSKLGGNPLTIESIAEDAIGVLDSLKLKKPVIVVGHSMGGIVASHLAAEYPDRVKGVILIGPVNSSPALAEPFQKRIEVVKKDGLEALADSIPQAAVGPKVEPLQLAFIRCLILGTSPEGYMALCNSIATAKKPNYGSIKAPLLLIAGAEDKTSPMASSQAIFEAYGTEQKNKRIETLDGVGHWHCVEKPEEVAKRVLAFVKSLL